jgi:DNA-binding CsgD family transcriptional regulator
MPSVKLRLGDFGALARVVKSLPADVPESTEHKRKMIAEFCKLLGRQYSAPLPDPTAGLSPRHVQTLKRMLLGDSEKQVARHLGVSPHTVHVYIKALYRHYDVNSRGELLAKFVTPPSM